MSTVFASLTGRVTGTVRSGAYKDMFTFDESTENISSGIHVATYAGGEWLMVHGKGILLVSSKDLPENPVNEFSKIGRWWKIAAKGQIKTVPTQLVFRESHDNEDVHVLMIPSVYDVRYRSRLVRIIGLLGKAVSGALMLVGVDPKRSKDYPNADKVQFEPLWREVENPKSPTMPGWSGDGSGIKPQVDKLSLSALKAKWYTYYVNDPSQTTRDDFDPDRDDYWIQVWERINLLEDAHGVEVPTTTQPVVVAEEPPEHDEYDILAKVKPMEFGSKRLADLDTHGGTAGNTGAPQIKVRDLNGMEHPFAEWNKKQKVMGTKKLSSTDLVLRKEKKNLTPYDIMLLGPRINDRE